MYEIWKTYQHLSRYDTYRYPEMREVKDFRWQRILDLTVCPQGAIFIFAKRRKFLTALFAEMGINVEQAHDNPLFRCKKILKNIDSQLTNWILTQWQQPL